MSLTSELSGRTKKGLYHVVVCPREGEDKTMTHEQWFRAAELIEQARGFTGQKRVMVMHEKKGRLHMHIAWERYNHETGLILCNKNSHRQERQTCRIMEREFGHQLTDEKNSERVLLKEMLPALFAQHTTGMSFKRAVEKAGYTLAKQKHRRDLVIINAKGRSFELMREIPGVRVKQMRERLKGLTLPDKNHVIDAIGERQRSRPKETERDKKRRDILNRLNDETENQKTRRKDRGR